MEKVEIKSLVYGGAGVGHLDNGKTVFVDDVVDGEVVEAEVFSDKKQFSLASLKNIISKSKYRIEPECKLSKVCGGCQWQHVEYEHQLDVKTRIVKDTLQKALKKEIEVERTIASPDNMQYRCKVQMPVSQTKNSKRILAGYFKKNSHELVNIKYCPIQPDIIGEICEYLKDIFQKKNIRAYDEKTRKGMIRHFVFRYSSTNKKILLIFVVNSKSTAPDLRIIADDVMHKFPQISGVCVNFNKQNSNVIMGENFELISGDDFVEENLEGRIYHISKGSFFQVNPRSAVNIFKTAEDMLKSQFIGKIPRLLDAYSGVGSFSIWMKDIADNIVAVEDYPQAVCDAKINLEKNRADNISLFEGDAQEVLDNFVKEGRVFDAVIIDPPRKGCSEKALEAVAALSKRSIVYVSCNPATLGRDLKKLEEFGFLVKRVQPVDMFCHTHHVETVVLLAKYGE